MKLTAKALDDFFKTEQLAGNVPPTRRSSAGERHHAVDLIRQGASLTPGQRR
jgi:hypothetical protein